MKKDLFLNIPQQNQFVITKTYNIRCVPVPYLASILLPFFSMSYNQCRTISSMISSCIGVNCLENSIIPVLYFSFRFSLFYGDIVCVYVWKSFV